MPDGTFALELRRRWSDGTTHLIFDPVELLERLAALVPRPRINLVPYHGVLAARATWRPAIVPEPSVTQAGDGAPAPAAPPDRAGRRVRPPNRTWAELMPRGLTAWT